MEEDIKCKIATVKSIIIDSLRHLVEQEIKLGKINNKCFEYYNLHQIILNFNLKTFILLSLFSFRL